MANDKDRLFERIYFLAERLNLSLLGARASWKGGGREELPPAHDLKGTIIVLILGNGLHMTRKGLSFDEFITFAQNPKALC